MLGRFVFLWILILLALSLEYLALNYFPEWSFLKKHFTEVTPEPGRPLSLVLGWSGFLTMLTTNFYILRKRIGFMQNWGKLRGWLDFHIFCGLVGPTFIWFHCNFKVGGLVAISFWSMMISMTSGVVGRYFYVQISSKRNDLENISSKWWESFLKIQKQSFAMLPPQELERVRRGALKYVGCPEESGVSSGQSINPFGALAGALIGDIKLLFALPPTISGLPTNTRYILSQYAVFRRQALLLVPFQRLMGYWHTFHLPFAFFMYLAAAIHIVAALMFGVSK